MLSKLKNKIKSFVEKLKTFLKKKFTYNNVSNKNIPLHANIKVLPKNIKHTHEWEQENWKIS